MALVINETNSVFGGTGISLNNLAVGGKVTVAANGIVSTPNFVAIRLNDPLPWTIRVDGLVSGEIGFYLPEMGPASTVTLGASGEIFTTSVGIYASTPTNIVNYGRIQSGDEAILNGSQKTSSITNYGQIISDLVDALGAIRLDQFAQNDSVGIRTIDNRGLISAFDGTDIGVAIYVLGLGKTIVKNSGTIDGHISLSNGHDAVSNSGTVTGYVETWIGNDTLTNSGTIEGAVYLGAGNDIFTNTGTVEGFIFLGNGGDTFTGGAKDEFVVDEGGNDKYNLGAGDDYFDAVATGSSFGTDTVEGGANTPFVLYDPTDEGDRYSAYYATSSVFVNLSNTLVRGIAAFTATGLNIGIDKITGFETAYGGSANDTLVGSSAANTLWGRAGNDVLDGLGGNDWIDGSEGNDRIVGRGGRDTLYGGADADTFVYRLLSDSTLDRTTRDVVRDFEDGIDHFDFNPLALTNETFIGQNVTFSAIAGQSEIRAISKVSGWSIQVDKNGDGKIDMVIDVADLDQTIIWDGSDFL